MDSRSVGVSNFRKPKLPVLVDLDAQCTATMACEGTRGNCSSVIFQGCSRTKLASRQCGHQTPPTFCLLEGAGLRFATPRSAPVRFGASDATLAEAAPAERS